MITWERKREEESVCACMFKRVTSLKKNKKKKNYSVESSVDK